MNQIQIDQHSDICITIYIQDKKDNFSVTYTQNLKKKKEITESLLENLF